MPIDTDQPTTATGARPYRITPQAYLVRERAAEYRSEYNDGELVAMAGASRRHNLICSSLTRRLGNLLDGSGCEVYASDMRVRLDAGKRYVYPDLAVACGGPVFEDDQVDVLLNPTVVVEILSPSTREKDRGWKFDAYRRIGSLREIVFLSQDQPMAEVHRRDADGEWTALLPLAGPEALLRLESIGCSLSLKEIYQHVQFASGGAAEPTVEGGAGADRD